MVLQITKSLDELMLLNFSEVMALMWKMEKGVYGPAVPAIQGTSGCLEGYKDPYLGKTMTQSASVHGLGSSTWGQIK